MRICLARCALVVFSTLILAGCQSGENTWHAPNWSLSKLNPFASLSGLAAKTPHPERPSTLVSPTSPTHPAAGYAAATSDMTEPGGRYSGTSTGYSTPPGGYSSTQWHRYPATQSSPLSSYGTARGATSGQSTVGPQDGLYDPDAGYRMSQQSSFSGPGSSTGTSLYSSNANSNLSGSPDVSSYRSANQDYNIAGATGPYGYASGAASQYGVTSDRYGSVPAATDPYKDLQNQRHATANLYASPDDRSNSPYAALPKGTDTTYGDARWPYDAVGSSRYERKSGSTDASPAHGSYSLTPTATDLSTTAGRPTPPARRPRIHRRRLIRAEPVPAPWSATGMLSPTPVPRAAALAIAATSTANPATQRGPASGIPATQATHLVDQRRTCPAEPTMMIRAIPVTIRQGLARIAPLPTPLRLQAPPPTSRRLFCPAVRSGKCRAAILSEARGEGRSSGPAGGAETDSQVTAAIHYPMPTSSAWRLGACTVDRSALNHRTAKAW
jgi:hypothetical protein